MKLPPCGTREVTAILLVDAARQKLRPDGLGLGLMMNELGATLDPQ